MFNHFLFTHAAAVVGDIDEKVIINVFVFQILRYIEGITRISCRADSNTDQTLILFRSGIGGVDQQIDQNLPELDGIRLNEPVPLCDFARKFNFVMLSFGVILLIISMILIVNTIKITLVSKRFLINTMRLVGATRWFIERPFVIRAVTQGLGAWAIASVMLAGMIAGLNEGLPEVGFVKTPDLMIVLFVMLLLLGVLISTLFTWIILRKMLKSNSKNIYLY